MHSLEMIKNFLLIQVLNSAVPVEVTVVLVVGQTGTATRSLSDFRTTP